jgi:hypothetical protein
MVTKLDRPLKRELKIKREPWIVTLSPTALKLTRKGRRKGLELEWEALISGDAALAAALSASLAPKQKTKKKRGPLRLVKS